MLVKIAVGVVMYLAGLQSAWAQALIVQISDLHSNTKMLPKTLVAADFYAQEFLERHPKGEVIFLFLGDHSSIHPENAEQGGWSSYEAIPLIRQRGYTPLFVFGNHDAFDWTVKIDGVQLFLDQMKYLQDNGVRVLTDNLKIPTDEMLEVLSEPYRLRTIEKKMRIVGLTIPQIMSKSNLTEKPSQRLFKGVEALGASFQRILPDLDKYGTESVIFAIHQGHRLLERQIPEINRVIQDNQLSLDVPLVMGAHDHLAAAFRSRGTLIADGGSHGSFNVIEIEKNGSIKRDVIHVARSEKALSVVQFADRVDKASLNYFTEGQAVVNTVTDTHVLNEDWIRDYKLKADKSYKKTIKRLSLPLVTSQYGIPWTKQDLKAGPNEWGSMHAESLVQFAKSQTEALKNYKGPILSMYNSSGYRIEEAIKPGEITEYQFREMYPFFTEASVHLITLQQAEELYFSLRRAYEGPTGLFSPHLPFNAREHFGELQLLFGKQWVNIKEAAAVNRAVYRRNNLQIPSHYIPIVIDGWLSEHMVGESYRIEEWLKVFKHRKPLDKKPYQDIIVEHLPQVILNYEDGKLGQEKHPNLKNMTMPPPQQRGISCRHLFQ